METTKIKKFGIVLILFLMFFWYGNSEDRRHDKSTLVIMTLNAEFLWDGVEPEEGQVHFDWKGSPTEAEERMGEIAKIIIRSNPDIVNLVEVENIESLDKLNNTFLSGRGYRSYLVNGTDTFTGQDVALLSRIDPETGRIERDDRKGTSGNVSKSVSKNYFAKFKMGDTKIALIGLHFLARPNDSSRMWKRQAQADAMRNLALELTNQGYSIVCAGDYNDYDGDSDSLDHIRSTPKTTVLDMIKKMDVVDASDDLVNAATFVPNANRYTAFFDKDDDNEIDFPDEFTSIDHILLSKDLVKKIVLVDIPHFHDPREVTDHFPIVVHLRLLDTTPPPVPVHISPIRIVSLLPNPSGNENKNESVTIKNFGSQPVNLDRWTLRDLAGKTWLLSGSLQAGEERTIMRNDQPMALNNRGDTIDVIDNNGNVVYTITYTRADEEEIITPPIR